MFDKLSHILSSKFSKQDDTSRQIEIAKTLNLFREELKKINFDSAEVISLKNKTLTVKVESSVAANELRFQENQIMNKINQELGKEALQRVVYKV